MMGQELSDMINASINADLSRYNPYPWIQKTGAWSCNSCHIKLNGNALIHRSRNCPNCKTGMMIKISIFEWDEPK